MTAFRTRLRAAAFLPRSPDALGLASSLPTQVGLAWRPYPDRLAVVGADQETRPSNLRAPTVTKDQGCRPTDAPWPPMVGSVAATAVREEHLIPRSPRR